MSTETMLDGLQVVEIVQGIAGPMCGKVLVDLGAAVTRIETPEGDWLRDLGAAGAVYAQLNAGKRVVALDGEGDRAELHALLRAADVCVLDATRAGRDARGLATERLQAIAPRLVICHVSGWGSGGPMADQMASELSVQVAAGLTRYLGTPDSPPVRQGFDLVSVDTGIAAVQAILAALLWREQSGEGQVVEVSMLSTAIALMQWDTTAFSGPDRWDGRQLTTHAGPSDHGFQTADTRCLIDLRSNEEAWPGLLRDLGCLDLANDPRFATRDALDLHAGKLPTLTAPVMSTWAFADLERLVRDKYDGTIVPMLTLEQATQHPQVQHIGVLSDGPTPRIRFPMDVF